MMSTANFTYGAVMGYLFLALGACTTQPISFAQYRQGEFPNRSMVYFSAVCTYDVTIKLRPRIRGEGVVQQDCRGGPDNVKLYSFALGEGIYSLSAWNLDGSFRWPDHTFDVGPPGAGTIYYWGRISVFLAPAGAGYPAVFVTEVPDDLRQISQETTLSRERIKVSFVEE